MWKGISKFLFLSLTVSRIRGNLVWTENYLHPVQGLFVKPSVDGTTGDLYVAATEDHGVDAHWLTDQPINFLPAAAATETKPSKIPVSFSSSFPKTTSPHEESATTQKRAIITSPQIKYAYTLPSTEGNLAPYPYYAVPVPPTSPESTPPCSTDSSPIIPTYPQFSPYHYFYPQMMAGFANGITSTSDASNENGSSQSQPSPYWPGYSYPYQYVMVDPASWLHGQPTTPSPATTANE